MSHGRLDHEEPLPPGVPEVTLPPLEPRLRRPPFGVIAAFLVLVIATWVPLVFFARERVSPKPEPRVQIFQDMGKQPRLNEQRTSDIFLDGRTMRPTVPGTVARGHADLDDNYYRGWTSAPGQGGKPQITFAADFPQQVKVTDQLVARGRDRFNIYCAPCHGIDGHGRGPVAVRADEIGNSLNVMSLHADLVRSRPPGHLFNTVTVGIRNMPGYAGQIPNPQDRWAIVAYVRSLQLSQSANQLAAETPDRPGVARGNGDQ
jgi:mono/diheme cytochrome c family protein